MNFTEIISLIGKSEKSENVKKMLFNFDVKTPLKRPPRGSDEISFNVENHPIGFCFVCASDDQIKRGAMEGELILDTIFFYNKPFVSGEENGDSFPFGFSVEMTRLQARKKFGSPKWTSPFLNNDRWIIDGFRVLVCFADDEKSFHQIAISLDS